MTGRQGASCVTKTVSGGTALRTLTWHLHLVPKLGEWIYSDEDLIMNMVVMAIEQRWEPQIATP